MVKMKDLVGKFIEDWREAVGRPEDMPSASAIVSELGCTKRTASKWLNYYDRLENAPVVKTIKQKVYEVRVKQHIRPRKSRKKRNDKRFHGMTGEQTALLLKLNEQYGLDLNRHTKFGDQFTERFEEFTVLTHYRNLPLRVAIDNCKVNGIKRKTEVAEELDIPLKAVRKFWHGKKRDRAV
jgi:hypothetical protein